MNVFETEAMIGPDGRLTLEQLPFSGGQAVRVRIEAKEIPGRAGGRVLGLHQGMVWMSEDFDEPLPDSFWVGKMPVDETPA